MADGAEHGDRVAALAVGRVIGVASQANLVAVKAGAHYVVDEVTGQHIQGAYLDEIYENWRWIVNDVRTRNPPRMGKAVINWCKGKLPNFLLEKRANMGLNSGFLPELVLQRATHQLCKVGHRSA